MKNFFRNVLSFFKTVLGINPKAIEPVSSAKPELTEYDLERLKKADEKRTRRIARNKRLHIC